MADKPLTIVLLAEARALGLKRYFTGKPCPRGHIAERYVLSRACSLCQAECALKLREGDPEKYKDYYRKRHKANRENRNAQKRKHYESNRETINEARRDGRKANPEKHRDYKRKYRKENLEKLNAQKRNRYKANPEKFRDETNSLRKANLEKFRERERNNHKANPEKRRAHKRNRIARKRGNGGTHTAADIIEIFKMQRGKCAHCRKKLGNKRHVDHIVPISRGGTNDRKNLQLLCEPCNLKKGARDPIDHARSLGFIL